MKKLTTKESMQIMGGAAEAPIRSSTGAPYQRTVSTNSNSSTTVDLRQQKLAEEQISSGGKP